MTDFHPPEVYLKHLHRQLPKLDRSILASLEAQLATCNWQEPRSAWEWNNLAVAALVEAETSSNSLTRGLYIEMAFNALHSGVELGDYPLCQAHLSLLYSNLGDYGTAADLAFNTFLQTLQPAYTEAEAPPGMIYLPPTRGEHQGEYLLHILTADNGYFQAMALLGEALCRSQPLGDNAHGLRLWHLLGQLLPKTFYSNLQLGLQSLGGQEPEGLLYLHRAQELVLDSPTVLHSLYLAYRDLGDGATSQYWLDTARDYGEQRRDRQPWAWTAIVQDSDFTYLPYETGLVVTEPSLNSLTTRSLLAQGDGYERELELWRQEVQGGMTVIDVGAHAGLYALSAALRVGPTGRVIAIEPSSFHGACLKETARLNHCPWLEVFAGAASDRLGSMPLYLQSPSEFHQVLGVEAEPMEWEGETETVRAFPLDAWIPQVNLQRWDLLKVSVVGHELAVLRGAQGSIARFRPQIFYHNLFNGTANIEVADFLTSMGYELFRYRPYVGELLPIGTADDLAGAVKVLARPPII
jgi:FkbM family methyltransferase